MTSLRGLLRLLLAPEAVLVPRCARCGVGGQTGPEHAGERLWAAYDGRLTCSPCLVARVADAELLIAELAFAAWKEQRA